MKHTIELKPAAVWAAMVFFVFAGFQRANRTMDGRMLEKLPERFSIRHKVFLTYYRIQK